MASESMYTGWDAELEALQEWRDADALGATRMLGCAFLLAAAMFLASVAFTVVLALQTAHVIP